MAAMEAGDEAKAGASSASISATNEQTLNLLVASSLGLGYLCFVLHGQKPKPLLAAIGAAHGALKGAKVLADLRFPPSPSSFLVASKALIKGYKASKRLNLIKTSPIGPSFFVTKRVKVYLRALNVVRYARSFICGDRFIGLGLLSSGYKLSKNFLKVVEDFTGSRFGSALRNVVDAVGLSIKTAIVVAEVDRIAATGRRGNSCRCGFPMGLSSTSRYVLHSKLKKVTIDCGFEGWKRFSVQLFASHQIVLISEQPPVISPSELLCLSIPVNGQSILTEIL